MYQGLQRKITSAEFILDLGLMCSPGIVGIEPGATRPKHSSIYQVNVKVRAFVQIFKE
jgi:hypothetical protein